MARFYGTVQGGRGQANRLGHANTGLEVEACSYQGKVVVHLSAKDDVDLVNIRADQHGSSRNPTGPIFSGTFDELREAIEFFARRVEIRAALALMHPVAKAA